MMILPSNIFTSHRDTTSKEAFAMHCCFGSWKDRPKEPRSKKVLKRVKGILQRHFLERLPGKNFAD
jgi:hypothetical protein